MATIDSDHPFKMSESEYRQHCEDMDGICVECGEIKYGDVEQDTEERICEECGAAGVTGFEQLLINDLVKFTEEE